MKPWFRAVVIALPLSLALSLAGAGCGKELCEEAYDKATECADNMKCTSADPLQRDRCKQAQTTIRSQNETLFKLACDEGEAQKYIDCVLDPLTCICP